MQAATEKLNIETCRIIRNFYGLKRPVTLAEALAEIKNLERKRDKGLLDDHSEILAARLGVI